MSVFRTFSFYACVVMVVLNLGIFLVGKHAQDRDLQQLALVTMICAALGAFSHWALQERFKK